MNKHTHRLVFCRHRGMRVPAAEHTRSAGKAAGGQTRATAVAMASVVVLGALGVPGLPGWPGQEAQARTLVGSVPAAQGAIERKGHQAWLNRTNPGSNLPVRSTDATRIASNSAEGADLDFQMKTLDDGRRLLIDQYKRQIIINWDSFNIAPGYRVEFDQVSGGTALNKIWDLKPSVILGSIKANGEVILESQNGGFIFGNGARVDAQRFVASALALSSAWTDGLRKPNPDQTLTQSLMFDGSNLDTSAYYRHGDAEGLVRGVVVEPGAEIRALAGGDVILVGPSVLNAGRIETPDGQTVLAAGQKVYMMSAAADPTQRGLVVAVDAYAERTINEIDAQGQPVQQEDDSGALQPLTRVERINDTVNVAENAAGGAVQARRGLINLVGMVVRQNGVLSATTAVKGDNGVITLEAASGAAFMEQSWQNGVDSLGKPQESSKVNRPLGQQMGTLTIGTGSRTEITADGPRAPQTAPERSSFAAGPEGDAQFNQAKAAYEAVTQTDSEVFLRSRISAMGKDVTVASGATLSAPAGLIELQALSGARGDTSGNTSYLINPAQGSAPEADDSRLTIEAGATVTVAGERDVILPTQRNQLSGRLFSSELADAPVQRGGVLYRQNIKTDASEAIRVANVKGLYDGLRRDAWEWMTVGGHITLATQGTLGVSASSVLDVSGGSVKYEAGTVGTTLLRKGDRVLSLAQANPGDRYDELIVSADGQGRYVGAFVQGFDAGSLTLSGTAGMNVSVAGVKGDVVNSNTQRQGKTAAQWAEAMRKAGTLGGSEDDRTHPTNSRAIGRPTALKVAPHLYASLRPTPMALALGQMVGQSQAFSLQRGLTLGNAAQPTSPERDLIDLSALKVSLGALQVSAPQVAVAPGATLPVAPGGQVRMASQGSLEFAGRIDAPQAEVELKSREGHVILSGTARLDLAGDQLDLKRRGVVAPEVLAVDGGSLTLSAGLSVLQQAGSEVNLSAGVVREATGDVRQGKAGALSVGLNTFKTLEEGLITLEGAWQMAGTLKAFDFGRGGTLAVSGLRTLKMVDADGNLAASNKDLQLASSFFSDHGFGSFAFKAIGDVDVASGVTLTPVLRNLTADFRKPQGALAKDTVLDETLRSGMQLSLQAQAAPDFALRNDGGAYKGMTAAASVRVGNNASVNMGAGGRIGLMAAGSVHVAGSLVARGGAVALAISGTRGGGTASAPDAGGDKVGYLEDQRIVLAGTGKIDVSGIDRTRALNNGRRDGQVLAGGTVSFNAQGGGAQAVRGQVITEADSEILLNGEKGALSFQRGQTSALYAGAGALSIESADGVLLQGKVSASAPDASVEGGRLSVSLSREGFSDEYLRQRDDSGNKVSTDHLDGERTLRVSASAPKELTQPQASATTALVSAELINQSGFEQVQLRAEGRVVLENNVSLGGAASSTPLRALAIDSPVLQLEGTGTHSLQATRVTLGDATNPLKAGHTTAALPAPTMADPAADVAKATLQVNAGLIEVHGHSVLQGVDRTELLATLGADHQRDTRTDGEVRLIGRTQDTNSSALTGSLNFAGDLLMRAGQVYATTLSQFSVQGLNTSHKVNVDGQEKDSTRFARIEVQAPRQGSTSRTPLSALAQLKLQAHTLDIDGVLRQPFGAIALKGDGQLDLGANSALSVSGEGVTVPVGRTIEGTTWVYTPQGIGPNGGATLDNASIVQQLGAANLVKGIHVEGQQLKVDPQSRIEAQAGGQLLTWEFLEGVMGSKNTLSRPGVYAIVPGYTYDFAPHDTEILATQAKAGTDGTVGKRITLAHDVTRTDANGQQVLLPKGTYTLLPAEYAVLPGALLVSALDQGSGALTQSAIEQDDGGMRVGGYFTAAGTRHTQGNDPRLAFLVEPEDTVRQQSDLSLTSVAQLLSRNAAKRNQALSTLPGDAGRVSLQSTQGFDWAARYNLAGGQFDLTMGTDMALVADADLQATDGVHQVSAEQLAATQAASVLLGGVRSGSTSAQEVTTLATSVKVLTDHGQASGGPATPVGELILAAKKRVEVAEGKTVQANGVDTGRQNDITFKGAGAALVVSHLANTAVSRVLGTEKPDAAASVTLRADAQPGQVRQAGAVLRGAAIDIDSTGEVKGLDSTVATLAARGDSGATVVETRRLGLGAKSLEVLQADATLTDREQLTLRSPGSITLQTGSTLGGAGMQRLVLDAPELKGAGQADAVARITAQHVVLRNSSGVAPSAGNGIGNLLVEAAPPVQDATSEGIRIEGGQQRLAFANAELKTTGDIVFAGQGQLAAQGSLAFTAARITAETGARHGAKAEGALTIASAANARTLGHVVGTGAKLAFTGQKIAQQGRIELTSGQIDLAGTAGVTLAEGSRTSAAGARIQQGERTVAATGGGDVSVVSTQGDVELLGAVDVSAPEASDLTEVGVAAGSIRFEALAAEKGLIVGDRADIKGRADQLSQSGRLDIEAAGVVTRDFTRDADGKTIEATDTHVGSLDRLATLAQAGGIGREVSVRTTKGNLTLQRALSAGRVSLTADDTRVGQGQLILGHQAHIDTTQAARRGGVVLLAAQNRVALQSADGQGAKVTAGAATGSGGDVLVHAAQGVIQTDQDTRIDAGKGRVVLRSQLNEAGTALRTLGNDWQPNERTTRINGSLTAGEVSYEAVKVAETTGNLVLGNAQLTALKNAASAFYTQREASLRSGLGLETSSALKVRYGHEFRSSQDMTLSTDWNLYTAGSQSFDLTLRAGRALTLNGHLSDGFATAGPADDKATIPTAMPAGYKAASMRLVGGADTSSAQPMRTGVEALATGVTPKGNLTVAGNKVVRTTDGSIELASSGHTVLQEAGTSAATRTQAAVYVAGRPVAPTGSATARSVWQRFTQQGGRLEVHARGDITAPAAIQGFGNWLLHTGNSDKEVAWATDFDAFRQGLGSMGGGDLRVVAGGHIRNLTAVAPTSLMPTKEPSPSSTDVQNGGNVTVRAGGDIAGGMFLLGRGQGALEAAGQITVGDRRTETFGSSTQYQAMAPVLGLMDGQWRLQAMDDAQVSAVYNPTALSGATSTTRNSSLARSVMTYSDDAAVSIHSLGGGVAWRADLLQGLSSSNAVQAASGLLALHTSFGADRNKLTVSSSDQASRQVLQMLPGSLEVMALGTLSAGGFPEGTSVAFELPQADLLLAPSSQGQFRVHGAHDVRLSQPESGGRRIAMLDFAPTAVTGGVKQPVTGSVNWSASNTFAVANLHRGSRVPATLTAGGDIDFRRTSLIMPKALDVLAQGDILNPSVRIQHHTGQDISRIEAGGSVVGADNGQNPSRPLGLMQLNGPGELQVQAGLSLDLRTAGGIEATGEGASLRVASGMRRQVKVDELVAEFLAPDAQARAQLVQYVQQQLAVQGLGYEQALALFRDMTPEHQNHFAMKQLVLPKFAREYVQPQAGTSDPVWAWLARAGGVSVADQGSALYAEYQAAQRALVSHVQNQQGVSGLSFEQALAQYRGMSNADKATLVDKRRSISPLMAMAFLAAEPSAGYAQAWQQRAAALNLKADDFASEAFQRFAEQVLLKEVQRIGSVATAVADSANELFNPRRAATRDAIWAEVSRMATAAGLNRGFDFQGDTDLSRSKVHLTGASGAGQSSIDLFTPGGGVLVGSVTATAADAEQAATRGLAAYGGGDVRSYSKGDFLVASQKVHIVGSGDIMLYSAEGDIDSGRGSNNAVTVPPKVVVVDAYGAPRWSAGKTTVGSGMVIFVDGKGRREGKISLLAPRGEVRALDAFIDAPSIELAGPVVGADNLQGSVAGSAPPPPAPVPVAVNTGLGAETAAGEAEKTLSTQKEQAKTPNSLLTVDVLGLGDAALPATAAGEPVKKDDDKAPKDSRN